MQHLRALILSNKEIAPDYYFLAVNASEAMRTARPGQFVMVRPSFGLDPLLRRPLSIHAVIDEAMVVLYRAVGKGTRLLSHLKKGDLLDMVGPLGRGFSLPEQELQVIFMAGGIGIAPLFFLADWIKCNSADTRMRLYYGARTEKELVCREAFSELGVEMRLATEDGSTGEKGLVTELVARDFDHLPPGPVFACGPHPMLKALSRLPFGKNHRVQFSLEAIMACGMGVCLGCALETRSGYAHVCRDGPVFDLGELWW
jgi:dihydroorotate dehydrogenase electron transfer subunit